MPNSRQHHPRPPGKLIKVVNPGKGKPYHRVVAAAASKGREWYLHATKGYRSYRA